MRNGLVRPHWVNPHVLCAKKTTSYKCESYKAMTRKEKMRFVKRQNLCFNCLKGAHRAEKCPSKNRCHHPKCAETHHRFLHDYFKKKVEETAMEDVKVYMSKLPQVQNIYRLRLSKWEQQNGEYISTYALLDTGNESTLIHKDFAKKIKLSSIEDSGELINVDEVNLYLIDEENTSSFHINKTLAIKRERFDMTEQILPLHFQQNGE